MSERILPLTEGERMDQTCTECVQTEFDSLHVSEISTKVVKNNYLCAKQDTRSVEFTKVTQGDDGVHVMLWNLTVLWNSKQGLRHVTSVMTSSVFDDGFCLEVYRWRKFSFKLPSSLPSNY